MKYFFVVFKKQPQEITNAYSLVDENILLTIASDLIQVKKEVENKLYTTQEFETMRDDLLV